MQVARLFVRVLGEIKSLTTISNQMISGPFVALILENTEGSHFLRTE